MTSGGTQGVTGDSSGPLSADSIYAQVRRSGREWRHYAFGMPSNCDHRDSPSTDRAIYTAHHQPPIFYSAIAADCARWDVGVGDPRKVEDRSDIRSGPLADALRRDRLPAFATIEPTDDGGNSRRGRRGRPGEGRRVPGAVDPADHVEPRVPGRPDGGVHHLGRARRLQGPAAARHDRDARDRADRAARRDRRHALRPLRDAADHRGDAGHPAPSWAPPRRRRRCAPDSTSDRGQPTWT